MSELVDNRPLLKGFKAGDPEALRTVFRMYAPGISLLLERGFSFRAGTSTVRFQGYDRIFDIEDALQDVFRRAFSDNARGAYDGLRPFRAWISTIARNVVINDYQARRRMLDRYVLDDDEEVASDEQWSASHDPLILDASPEPTGEPELDAEARELRGLMRVFRDGLNERERRIFEWRYEQGLSHTEITAETGISASKIKTSEARIRKSLLTFMRRHGYLGGRGMPKRPADRPVGNESS